MSIGQRIKKLRNNLGFTQDKLASDAKMSRSYLADVENDRYNPSFDTLERIAEALNVSTDRLTGEAVSSIIEDRLKEKEATLEEISEKTGVSLYWLQNLDTFTPGVWGGKDDMAYKWITKIARALGLPGSTLRAALARQEPPVYDGPLDTRSIEEIFADENFDDVLPEQISNDKLTEEQILTLAAHQVGHKGTLSETDLDKIKLAVKIALAKDDK